MPEPIVMPRIGQSVESCIITKWHKSIGDFVKRDEPLFSYETDKAAFELESPFEGILLETFFEEGDDVPCMTNVGVIGQQGDDTTALRPDAIAGDAQSEAPPPAPAVEPAGTAAAPASAGTGDGIFLSPRARRLAAELRIDARQAQPSGAEGRILERDVLAVAGQATLTPSAFAELPGHPPVTGGSGIGGRITTDDLRGQAASSEPQAAEYQETPLTKIRQIIASSMQASLSQMAQLSYHAACNATGLLALRQELKGSPEEFALSGITVNDLLLFGVSRILADFPLINAHFDGNTIKSFREVHLGVAVNTDRGLMVPTIFSANRKSLREISAESKQIATQCQQGTVNPDLLRDATFTVSNLGAFGVSYFTPIINPPQTAILGVGNITGQVDLETGAQFPALGLSLTADHRVVDGVPAAQFLKRLCLSLERISLLLAL